MTRTSRVTAVLVILVVFGVFDAGSRAIATTYYVTTSGNDSANGLTEATAWRTIQKGASTAVAGDIVYIKAGNYGNEHVTMPVNGTIASPIVFEGYRNTPGDNPQLNYTYGMSLNAAVMPLLDGGNRATAGTGINLISRKYITVKNIQITNYVKGLYGYGAQYLTIDNVITMYTGDINASYSGHGITIGSNAHYNLIKNCIVVNSCAQGLAIVGNNNVVENSKAFCGENQTYHASMDYYIVVVGNHNTITGCHVERVGNLTHGGHGIGVKKDCEHNTFNNCTAVNTNGIYVRWHGAKYNTFNNCRVSERGGLIVRDGASYNTFSNCTVEKADTGIYFHDTDEDTSPVPYTGRYNVFKNCIFKNNYYGIRFFYYSNNKICDYNTIVNCVFYKGTYLFETERLNNNNKMVNCIVSNFTTLIDPSTARPTYPLNFEYTYTNFYSNGFATPAGTGNISVDPRFVNAANGDFHLQSQYGRWNGAAWVKDTVTSPCIDAGDPASEYNNEPTPNGDRINMGAYGNTDKASKSETAETAGRYVFYNKSTFDGNNAAANADDDGAIAPDKTALLPGGTATFANYTSYSKGINGIMIDIAGLPGTPTASDFTFKVGNDNTLASWATAAVPMSIAVREGAGIDGADRITIVWASSAIQKQWLQVTVKATTATGLASDDVFYFGNAIGETGNSATDAMVKPTDEIGARNNPHTLGGNPAGIDDVYDFDRDKKVGPTDEIIARNHGTNSLTALKLITVP